eukprot:12352558-Alexandrium_andersonii.AAC.1
MRRRSVVSAPTICWPVLDEARLLETPYLIAGDLNVEVSGVAVLRESIAEGEVFDIGAIVALAGPNAPEATCRAHGSKHMTRRDYIFASRQALKHVA